MAPKRRGHLQRIHKDAETFKKKVDFLATDVHKRSESTSDLIQRCQKLQIDGKKTLKALNGLTKADEPAPVGNYEQRKQEEVTKLQNILKHLETLFLELSPPGPSSTKDEITTEDGEKEEDEADDSNGVSNEDDDDDNNDDDDDDDDEETEHVSPLQSGFGSYTVLCDFSGEQEGDLTVKKGEVLTIIRKTADGWWLAQNAGGNRGLVPKNYLKFGVGVSEEEESDEDNDEDGSDEMEDIPEKSDEEKYGDAENRQSTPHSNWSTVRKALTEIDATDVLSAMGAIPSGFRPSTLNKLHTEEGIKYKGSHYLQPELSQSQLSFKDLFFDPDSGRVRPRQVKVNVCFTLWSCKQIPTPGVGVQVLSRHIHLCAFDGNQVLSNINTVRVTYNPKSPKTWTFSPRMSGILPTLLDGDCFLRCNSSSPDLGILFELGVTFIRNSTGERGDLSCGWAFLKLTDDSGNLLPNRTYELPVNGGTPYEKDVAVEASATRGSPTSVFQQMLQSRRQPKLIIKLKSPDSRTRALLSLLPDTLLHSLSCVRVLTLHRQLLCDTLLMDRPTMQSADLICSPVLATFPLLLDQPDLLDALRSAWTDVDASMSRSQRRNLSHVKQEFYRVYMSSVYFLLHSPALPSYHWADPSTEEQRARIIYTTLDSLKHKQLNSETLGGAEVYLTSDHEHLAFDISECTFDLLSVARQRSFRRQVFTSFFDVRKKTHRVVVQKAL
ncbi:nephrocystin-1 [Boleophthalmus pectinirostris]|uniref:nephrocystin-1 n=1 Tax=Boleophthalmus pectinirostris TaxID=150288 RepID=UPI00242A842F|nr:nephrocystin-1 [Boleophthalmus pectinirostris]